jgi:glycosyltransferase involved in cell wall biosynthesis
MVEKPRVLMALFGSVDFDGRVQRSAQALSAVADVKVLAFDGGHGFVPVGYELVTVPARPGEFGTNRWLHLRFLRALIRLARRERPDLIYGHDFFMALSGWLAARLSGARYVYDAHELLIPGSMGRTRGQLQERIWYLLERAVVGRADLVIAANSPRAQAMQRHYGLAHVPTAIRNLPPPPVSRMDDATIRSRYPALVRRNPSECLCVYQGDVDFDRGLAALLDAFEILPEDYRLLVVGGGPDVERVRARGRKPGGTAQVDVLGRVPRDDLFDILRLCDVGVVTYSFVGYNNLYCAPNKVFEYAQGGIPVVATGQPSLVELVADSGIGCIAGDGEPPTPQQLADAIVKTRNGSADHVRAIKLFLERNTWQLEAERLCAAVSAVIRGAHVEKSWHVEKS